MGAFIPRLQPIFSTGGYCDRQTTPPTETEWDALFAEKYGAENLPPDSPLFRPKESAPRQAIAPAPPKKERIKEERQSATGSINPFHVLDETEMLCLDAQVGDIAIWYDVPAVFVLKQMPPTELLNWQVSINPPIARQEIVVCTESFQGNNWVKSEQRIPCKFNEPNPYQVDPDGSLTFDIEILPDDFTSIQYMHQWYMEAIAVVEGVKRGRYFDPSSHPKPYRTVEVRSGIWLGDEVLARALDTWVAAESLPDFGDDDGVISYMLCTTSIKWFDPQTNEMPQKTRELHGLAQAGILTSDEVRAFSGKEGDRQPTPN